MSEIVKKITEDRLLKLKECLMEAHYKIACIGNTNSDAFQSYCKSIRRIAEQVSVEVELFHAENDLNKIGQLIQTANIDPNIQGILLEQPMKFCSPLESQNLMDQIDSFKDIDILTRNHKSDIAQNVKPHLLTAVTQAIFILMDAANIDLQGKKVVVIGRGSVGKIVADECLNRNASISIIHSKTLPEDQEIYLKMADVVISAVGIAEKFSLNQLSNPSIPVFDAGTTFKDGKLVGDFVRESLSSNMYFSNFGRLTSVCLLENMHNLQRLKRNGR